MTGRDDDDLFSFKPSESVLAASSRPPPANPGADQRYFIDTIGPPEERPLDHPDGTVLPEEAIPFRPYASYQGSIVAQGHEWSPVGLWGKPGDNRIWVLDSKHFGAHPLNVSQFKQGIIERIVAPDLNTIDYRIDAGFHLVDPGTNTTNNELSVIVGSADTIWVANGLLGRLDGLRRSDPTEISNLVQSHCIIIRSEANGDYTCDPLGQISPGLRPDASRNVSLWLNASDRLVPAASGCTRTPMGMLSSSSMRRFAFEGGVGGVRVPV